MPKELSFLPPDAIKITLVLALSFLIGLEREEHKQRDRQYAFGGVRAFPLIGLLGYALALLSAPEFLPWMIGLAVLGGLMIVSFIHKVTTSSMASITSEVLALVTYLTGALVQREHFWIASTMAVLSLLLLELKAALEGLAQRVASVEILATVKFLLLTVVILPIVPNQEFTSFHINPFKTWLVVVAVSGVSFCSYLLQRLLEGRQSVFLSALLGGAYSSTATTVVLARQSREQRNPGLFSGGILVASGVMYARLAILVAFFNVSLAKDIAPGFAGMALLGIFTGWLLGHASTEHKKIERGKLLQNPLQLNTAFLLALAFLVSQVLITVFRKFMGPMGLYTLAVIVGAVEVDPFVLSLAQAAPAGVSLGSVATTITIAAASNNVIKAVYAYSLSERATGTRSAAMLIALAAIGLLPLIWL